MLDLLALVILIAIFFGISLGAALNGALVALLVIFALSAIFVIIEPYASAFSGGYVPAKNAQKKPKKPAKSHPIIKGVVAFVIIYFISLIFLIFITSFLSIPYVPMPILLTITALPGIAYVSKGIIKTRINKKHAKHN